MFKDKRVIVVMPAYNAAQTIRRYAGCDRIQHSSPAADFGCAAHRHIDARDLFDGASLGENKKSLAINVVLQPVEKTLTDAEIDDLESLRIDLGLSKHTASQILDSRRVQQALAAHANTCPHCHQAMPGA